jgi:hypothetical protein
MQGQALYQAPKMLKPLRIMMAGDLVLDEPGADRFFDSARSTA